MHAYSTTYTPNNLSEVTTTALLRFYRKDLKDLTALNPTVLTPPDLEGTNTVSPPGLDKEVLLMLPSLEAGSELVLVLLVTVEITSRK